MEMASKSVRVVLQNRLTPTQVTKAMVVELEPLDEVWLTTFYSIQAQKKKIVEQQKG